MHGESSEAPGYVSGDLIFIIKEQNHKTFRRDGMHLYIEKEVPLVNALVGFKFVVTHLDDRKILVNTGPGDIIKPLDVREIRNEGMPVFGRPYEHGNLYVVFSVKFPTKLTSTQIDHLKTCIPGLLAAPQEEEYTELTLSEVDEESLKQDRYRDHGHGNACDESTDEEDGHVGGGVQCAQQ